MKILVARGAGFIGSAAIRHIIQNTNVIFINADKPTFSGNFKSLACVADNPRYVFE